MADHRRVAHRRVAHRRADHRRGHPLVTGHLLERAVRAPGREIRARGTAAANPRETVHHPTTGNLPAIVDPRRASGRPRQASSHPHPVIAHLRRRRDARAPRSFGVMAGRVGRCRPTRRRGLGLRSPAASREARTPLSSTGARGMHRVRRRSRTPNRSRRVGHPRLAHRRHRPSGRVDALSPRVPAERPVGVDASV